VVVVLVTGLRLTAIAQVSRIVVRALSPGRASQLLAGRRLDNIGINPLSSRLDVSAGP